MAKSFKLLRDKMSPESQARAEEKAQKMLAQMPMQELQRARFLSQDNIAETLHLGNNKAINRLIIALNLMALTHHLTTNH
jgi:hypothetical protein